VFVEQLLQGMDYEIRIAGADVSLDVLPPCRADAAQLSQVFSNLVSNALKYLDPKRRGVIRISGSEAADGVVYRIQDNGVGIAPQDWDRIFDPLVRVEGRDADGEGLGLTVVKTVVERHGGKVWLESAPGKGSTFFISLPR
ncbi:MAG TPA: ATP-binding protein, partial [bacterium]|nr:ATP-binding protein [bacterium]